MSPYHPDMETKGLCAFGDATRETADATARELALTHLRDDPALEHVVVVLTVDGKKSKRDRVYLRTDFGEFDAA